MPSRSAPRPSPWICATASIACALFAASASAEPEPVRLAWVRGPGAEACASQLAVVQQITARLGRSPFAADAPRSIDAYLTAAEGGFRAEIFVRDRTGKLVGSRELTSLSADCAAIESATVLALALAIDPEAALRPPSPVVVPGPVVAPAPAPIVAPAPAPVIVAPPSPVAPSAPLLGRSGVALRGGAAVGVVPRAAGALTLAASAAIGDTFELTTAALWIPEVTAADARFAFGVTALSLGGCVRAARASTIELAACGALWGGAIHAVVHGIVPDQPGDRPWAAVSLAPRLRLGLVAGVHLELGAELLVPVIRRAYTLIGQTAPVFELPAAAFFPSLGLGVNFR